MRSEPGVVYAGIQKCHLSEKESAKITLFGKK